MLLIHRSFFESPKEVVGVHCSNVPLDLSPQNTYEYFDKDSPYTIVFYTFGTSISFTVSLFIMFVISDRESKMKEIQHASGVSIYMYWGVSFVWDYLTYCAYISIYQIPILRIAKEVPALEWYAMVSQYALQMMFGLFSIPFVYLLGYKYTSAINGFLGSSFTNILLGVYCFLLTIGYFEAYKELLSKIIIHMPSTALLQGAVNVGRVIVLNHQCMRAQKSLQLGYTFMCDIEEYSICCGKV